MHKTARSLARLWSLVLAVAACAGPAHAQVVTNGRICAVLTDDTGTQIEIADLGGVANVTCHGRLALCEEGVTVCVNHTFEASVDAINREAVISPDTVLVFRPAGFNLAPSRPGGPFHLCEPFYQPISDDGSKRKPIPIFLTPTGNKTFTDADGTPYPVPVYDLDAQEPAIPLGTLIQVVLDARPTGGKCVGMRTTIQHRKGTCKIWKVRKFYNTCSSSVTITEIKELERPCVGGTFAAQAGPDRSVTAVASDLQGQFITLASAGNTGARVRAGSLAVGPGSEAVDFVFCLRSVFPNPTPAFAPTGPLAANRTLAVLLDFRPGGVTLKPANQPGSEKLVTYHIDIQ
jgi:hypothetical protein